MSLRSRIFVNVLALAALAAAALPALATPPVASARASFDRDGVLQRSVTGLADVAAQRLLTADDPVRIASVSKLVMTIGVLRLVEDRRLGLDTDISVALGYPLRNPAFPDTPITLRMLLSHTSSLTDNAGYYATPLGENMRGTFDDARAWDFEHAPGTFFRYGNINFPVIAAAMERVSGERFDQLMQRLVFEPLRIDACYNWASCDDAAIGRAVVLYDAAELTPSKDDLHGKRPDCAVNTARDGSCDLSRWTPGSNGMLFSPQGGLRISLNGLTRIGRMLLNRGELEGVRILQPASVQAFVTPQWTFDGRNGAIIEEDEPDRGGFFCRYGLAMQHLANGNGTDCRDDLFGDGRPRVGHSGNAYGLLSGLWLDMQAGTGVAYFVTGAANDSDGAHSAFSRTEEAMATGSAPSP